MAKEIKDKKIEELEKDLFEKRNNLRVLKSAGSKSKNVKEQSSVKKDIARILTEINTRSKSL